MAKVYGAMFSEWASGTIGKTITCYNRRGYIYMAKKRSHFEKPKGTALMIKELWDKNREQMKFLGIPTFFTTPREAK